MQEKKVFVSIIVPCRNEELYISKSLEALIANDYPKDKLEILVVDGMSDDGTREVLEEYVKEYPFIRVLDNPSRVTPVAFNMGIKQSVGDMIMIMSAHAVVPVDYVSKCIRYSLEYQADNVGGVRLTKPGNKSVFGRAIAHSISHPFAAGTAVYRTGAKSIRWVDTVFGGCYRKDVFQRIGFFDERLAKGQDREFNVRLRQAGGKILMVPDIVTYYYARGDLGVFFRWMWVVGLTPIYMSKVLGRRVFSERNLVPPVFVLWLVLSFLLSFVSPISLWLLLTTAGIYLTACLCFSVPIAAKEKDPRFLVAMPFIFGATHILYGAGALAAIFKSVKPEPYLSKSDQPPAQKQI
jgi:succinoglycan biosynthesis protein ExoA